MWPSSDVTWYPFPLLMKTGKGAVCSKLLVFPPGKLLTASSWNFKLVGFLTVKRAFAASSASLTVASPLFTWAFMSVIVEAVGATTEGDMVVQPSKPGL